MALLRGSLVSAGINLIQSAAPRDAATKVKALIARGRLTEGARKAKSPSRVDEVQSHMDRPGKRRVIRGRSDEIVRLYRPDRNAIQRHVCSGPPRPPESLTSPSAAPRSEVPAKHISQHQKHKNDQKHPYDYPHGFLRW